MQPLSDPRRHVNIRAERVADVSSTDFPGHYPGEDHSWSLNKFKQNLQVKVQKLSQRSIDFDIVGVDASIANAFRRIMIAEVPTVCIESVYVWNNTSVIVDEVLAQRIGMVPLNVDPAVMEMKKSTDEQPTDRNTMVFKLQVACTRSTDRENPYINDEVLSGHLTWEPVGEQIEVFASKPPAPTNPNIVLAKLRPGQEVNMELHAVKGVGKDHAKFSPVATASYRLLPYIQLNPEKPVPSQLAEKFQKCFSKGVIRIDPRTEAVSVDPEAVRDDTVSREVLRHPEFEGCVELKRIRDYFLFNVESEGAYPPERLLPESIHVFRTKLETIRLAALSLRAEDVDMNN